MIRFGVVGTNFISDRFCNAVSASGCAEVTAVCSRDAERGRRFAERNGVGRGFTDYGGMLGSDIDAVYIATPNSTHCEYTIAALKKGKHVLCEKPISTDHGEFIKMKRCAEENGRILLEAMRPAFDPARDILLEQMKKIGKIRRATLEFCQYSSRYDRFLQGDIQNAFDPSLSNAALMDIGVYPLHDCLMLFGEPDTVSAHSIFLSNGFEGEGIVTLGYPEMIAEIVYSKITDSVTPSVIQGELGSILLDKISGPRSIRLLMRGGEAREVPYSPEENNMVYEIREFCRMAGGLPGRYDYLAVTDMQMRILDRIRSEAGIRFS